MTTFTAKKQTGKTPMETEKANRLIEQIWDIQEQLKTVQIVLTSIEYSITDDVPDEE